MGRFVFLWLAVSCILHSVNCQNVQNQNILNPDAIYFADNRPSVQKAVNRPITPSNNLQPPYNGQNSDQAPSVTNVIETSTRNWNQVVNPVNPFLGFNMNIQQAALAQSFNPVRTNQIVQGINNVQGINVQDIAPDRFGSNINKQRPAQTQNRPTKFSFSSNAEALTSFSLNVMKSAVRQKQGNMVMSPYSIASILALLQQGATKLTLMQISEALQMTVNTSAEAYRTQNRDILSRNTHNILRTANNIYVADSFALNPQFRVVAQRDFNSEVTPTHFSNNLEASRIINKWVASKTDNKIDNLLSPDSISPSTQMVLVNAIYFKGLWAVPFRENATELATFYVRPGFEKRVPFMMLRRYFVAGEDRDNGAKVINIPFEFNEYSITIILPTGQSTADGLLSVLTPGLLARYQNYKRMEVALQIPKFSIKADTDLTPVLRQMGITQIFDENSGLDGLGSYQSSAPQVSSAIHSALLSIDEHGSVAAAASAVTAVALSNDDNSMAMKVDRPFLAVLWDEKNRIPLFMAKIEEPIW